MKIPYFTLSLILLSFLHSCGISESMPSRKDTASATKICQMHDIALVPKTTYQRHEPYMISMSDRYMDAFTKYPNTHCGVLWDAVDSPTKSHTKPRVDYYCVECQQAAVLYFQNYSK